ncbi:MAG: metallophosphoesterase, partial [Pseudomonadota bacterium]
MRLSSIFLAIYLLAIGSTLTRAENFSLTILHINDVHSRIQAINKFNSTCKPKENAAGKCFGGMARVKTAIDARRMALKRAGKNAITLDAGDQFQGSLFYTTYKGSVAVEVMNRIGFDAMAVGNHEFDDGPQALAAFAKAAKFPILSANTDLSKVPELASVIGSYIVKSVAGERIAIVSVLAEDTDVTSSPGPNVRFLKSETVLKSMIENLEVEGINKIILLSHVGLKRDLELAASVSGIDVIVGGHSHTHLKTYPKRVEGPNGKVVPIVQAYAYSKFLGELEVTWDKFGDVVGAKGKVHLLDARIKEDAELAAFIKSKSAPFDALRQKVVGLVAEEIDGSSRRCRTSDCPMGKLVTEAMLDRVKSQGITIAILNGGGIRASLDAGRV